MVNKQERIGMVTQGGRSRPVFATIALLVGSALTIATAVNPPSTFGGKGDNDWPTHRHDSSRSGFTSDPVDTPRLRSAWTWHSDTPPNPAWDGPARWDAYAGIRDLPAMRQYDASFQPVSDGETVYFGSSSEDELIALDLATGKRRWHYVSGGPIRLAPTFWKNKVYFGCDDGYAYCLDAKTGSLLWRFNPSVHANAEQRLVINNQRLISFYPIRTGVLIRDGHAYFGAALLPWRDAYLCAVDAETGNVEAPGTFVTVCEDATLEGPILATEDRLIVPQGRIAPLLFDRRDGKSLGSLPGGGGVTIVLTDEGEIVRTEGGKTARAGQIGVFDGKERIASFPRGRSMVVHDRSFYVIDNNQIFAASRKDNDLLWKLDVNEPVEIIMAGTTLFVGCRDEVVAVDAQQGSVSWRSSVDGRAFGLAVSAGRLIVSTDEGTVQVFAPTSPAPWEDRGLETKVTAKEAATPETPDASPLLSWGPVARFVRPGAMEIEYGTYASVPTRVTLQGDPDPTRFGDATPKREHRVTMEGLPFRRHARYRIDVGEGGPEKDAASPEFQIDTHFDWMLPPATEHSDWAANILADSRSRLGMAIVVGESLAERARELARASQLSVQLIVDDEETAHRLRQAWTTESDANGYGMKLAVRSGGLEPLPGAFAAVVVARQDTPTVRRLVRPAGGTLWVDGKLTWKRPALDGAGVWDHMYGVADNSAFGGELLSHAVTRDDLVVQWIGKPGPRYQTDRENRKPSPLAVGGRLYLQGQQRLIGLDVYSGSVLWSLETPTVMRWNVPHDCSNWCADTEGVYVAAQDQAWLIDGDSGKIRTRYRMPESGNPDKDTSWGYIARHHDLLLGTQVKSDAIYSDWWGGEKWFDSTDGGDTHVVLGDQLFAVDPSSGDVRWTYDGLIIHPTITVLEDRLFFVEDRTPAHLADDARRVALDAGQEHFLVCLKIVDGSRLFERRVDPFSGRLSALYLAGRRDEVHGNLLLVASEATKKHFTIQQMNPDNGEPTWSKIVKWESDNHGKHISRPAIQGSLLYLRPEVLNIHTGETMVRGFPPGHGCASYALCSHGLIGRLGSVTWWDPRSNSVSRFPRIRPDCWISTIPAQGMLLSPEGGGGCSCGSWLETSLAFLPRNVDSLLPEAQ